LPVEEPELVEAVIGSQKDFQAGRESLEEAAPGEVLSLQEKLSRYLDNRRKDSVKTIVDNEQPYLWLGSYLSEEGLIEQEDLRAFQIMTENTGEIREEEITAIIEAVKRAKAGINEIVIALIDSHYLKQMLPPQQDAFLKLVPYLIENTKGLESDEKVYTNLRDLMLYIENYYLGKEGYRPDKEYKEITKSGKNGIFIRSYCMARHKGRLEINDFYGWLLEEAAGRAKTDEWYQGYIEKEKEISISQQERLKTVSDLGEEYEGIIKDTCMLRGMGLKEVLFSYKELIKTVGFEFEAVLKKGRHLEDVIGYYQRLFNENSLNWIAKKEGEDQMEIEIPPIDTSSRKSIEEFIRGVGVLNASIAKENSAIE